jgi:hypothetical protein
VIISKASDLPDELFLLIILLSFLLEIIPFRTMGDEVGYDTGIIFITIAPINNLEHDGD